MSLEMSINNFEYETKAAEAFLDLYGHVNHAHYLTMFEDSRWAYYSTKGITKDSVVKGNIGPIVLKANITYKKEINADETILIKFKTNGYKYNLWHLQQIMYKENGKIACHIDYTFGLFDITARKLVAPFGIWVETE